MKIADGLRGSAEADNEMKKRQIASRVPRRANWCLLHFQPVCFSLTEQNKKEPNGSQPQTEKKKTLTAGLRLPRLMTRRRAH